MNPAVAAFRKRTLMTVLTLLLVVFGIRSYFHLGRLEYPNFTIKTAMVITPYPGASPSETEKEVTDRIEEALQSLKQLKRVTSTSREGLSIVYADIRDEYVTTELPQVWDELRRKVGDIRGSLPPGAGPSVVRDDFGDVYGLFFALTGRGYTYAQLEDYAKTLKNELLFCRDVAKISLWGTRQETAYVEFRRSRMVELGLSPEALVRSLTSQNSVLDGGKVEIGEKFVRIVPTGGISDESRIADLLIGGRNGLVRLGDLAAVSRGYEEPPKNIMRFNGEPAVGIGISVIPGGNVVAMGESVRERIAALETVRPLGMKLTPVYYQSDIVVDSVNQFVVNLAESIVVVIGLLLLFMGLRSGLVIGIVLLLTILGTFIGMDIAGIELQKVSLGALVLALGILVDNAIVVADGILIRIGRGEDREEAACAVVRETQWPLLGATAVAILAFAAISFAPGKVGELCRSLFQVMAISLSLSWILAVTVTPLLCAAILKSAPEGGVSDPYDGRAYHLYRRFIHACLKHRMGTMGGALVLLAVAIIGFGRVPQSFFPNSTQPYFYVSLRRSQGTHIGKTSRDMAALDAFVRTLEGVRNVTTFVGEGALRFIISYCYESPDTSYGQLLVEVSDYRDIGSLIARVERHARENLPDAETHCFPVKMGPPKEFTIELRFRGPETGTLSALATQAEAILRNHPDVRDIRTDWRQPVFTIRPVFSEERAKRTGVSRSDLLGALQWNSVGRTVGLLRDGTRLIPIVSRPVPEERAGADRIGDIQVWSAAAGAFVPLGQAVSEIGMLWENPLVHRRNRQKTVTVQANPVTGLPEPLRRSVRAELEAIRLPSEYSMEWGGEYADSQESRDPLKKSFPLCLGFMFVILVGLFNSVRRPLIVFLTTPLAVTGVTAGLLLTGQPFGFMAILGFLGLSGMLIKNAIVLIDQIELDRAAGKSPYAAVLDSAVSRLRPVTMAAGTTILGMAPLIRDPLYAAMAVTIMGGLAGGTVLTLVIVPALYCMFFRIPSDACAL